MTEETRKDLEASLKNARAFAEELDRAHDRFAWESGTTGLKNAIADTRQCLESLRNSSISWEVSSAPGELALYNQTSGLVEDIEAELAKLDMIAAQPYRRWRMPKIRIAWSRRKTAVVALLTVPTLLTVMVSTTPRPDQSNTQTVPATVPESTFISAASGERKIARSGMTFDALKGSFVTAERGSVGTAYDGSNVLAKPGATVTARTGSIVFADDQSTVHALDGSEIFAKPGAKVDAENGSRIKIVRSFPAFVQ